MKKKLTWKIWLLIIFLIFSLLAIFGMPPNFLEKGVMITSVDSNSSLFEQGMRQGQILTSIDGQMISSIEDYSLIIQSKFPSSENVKTIFETKQGEFIIFSSEVPDLTVEKIPDTKIKLGLDLEGGARALVKAENKSLDTSEINDLVDITSNRLNEFGLTDLKVLPVSDLSGNHFMLIEIAGATPRDLKSLISEQGKFEAKIGDEVAFEGGSKDIASVGRDAQNARIEGCNPDGEGSYFCRFSFTITLSGDAAKRHAEITENLSVNTTPQGNYLSKKLDLYLDDKLVDSLLIGESLKGRVTTQISISGSGSGASQDEAYESAVEEMKKLQTILITGSLPYKLEIVKLDTISPTLGKEFVKIILLAGIAALLAVALIVFIRYRKIKISLALLLTTFSEVIIILGIASLIDWNIDLPGIAGILATIGTGIDDLIVILDESVHSLQTNLKQRLKRAFAIIMGAYFTSLVSLLPLLWAGAGLLKGFAITTIIGISVGVLITRPAFSDLIKRFQE
ncbi:MAG: preprotein translocase subunit SecD [Nanoarchaeota archaeon]|nr:preprotein translocase subunit SecD [Nanoarchaeota archaeon]